MRPPAGGGGALRVGIGVWLGWGGRASRGDGVGTGVLLDWAISQSWPDTYQPKYLHLLYLFLFRILLDTYLLLLDTYLLHIHHVSDTDTYPIWDTSPRRCIRVV